MKAKPARIYSETELLFLSAGYPIRETATTTASPRGAAGAGMSWRGARRLAGISLASVVRGLSRLTNRLEGRTSGSHPGV